MIEATFAIPGDIDLPTGGYMYDRRVLALLPHCGIAVRHVVLPGSFPDPSPADLAEAARLLTAAHAATPVIVDGLAYGAMPAALLARVVAPMVALVHHPLCLETGLAADRGATLRALETAALARAVRVIATSAATARTLTADFAVPAGKITVAEPGTDRARRAAGSGAETLHMVTVGSVVPRKAYDVLVRALVPLRERPWRLTIAGAIDRSAEAVAALQAAIGDAGFAHRVHVAGPVSQARLADLYASADLFVLPSLYEGYGMVLGEAMARGLPIVCTTGGAAAETAPDAAAVKVPPGDEQALSLAIRRLLDAPELRNKMADASWAAGQTLPRWEDTARIISDLIKELHR